MNKELIFIIVSVLLLLMLVISIIKKAGRLILLVILILVGIFAVDIFIYGQTPIEEISAYRTNLAYSKNVVDLTIKVKDSATNIKSILEKDKLDQASIETLKKENDNLHQYQKLFKSYQHTKRLDGFHSSYDDYLSNLIAVSDKTVKVISSNSKTIENAQELLNKVKGTLDNLTKLDAIK